MRKIYVDGKSLNRRQMELLELALRHLRADLIRHKKMTDKDTDLIDLTRLMADLNVF